MSSPPADDLPRNIDLCNSRDLTTDCQKNEENSNEAIIESPQTIIRHSFRRRPRHHVYVKYTQIEEWRMRHMCGIHLDSFDWFMRRLKPRKNIYERYMDKEDQLILTLLKYKLNYSNRTLAMIYNVPRSIVKAIFIFWTVKLYKYFKQQNAMMDAELAPISDFKSYSSIISCVELKTCQVPKYPAINRMLLSHENGNCNTFKYLVAVRECGKVTYCSDLFGGSLSHIEVFKRCGYLESVLRPGDVVLSNFDDGLRKILRDKNIKLHTVQIDEPRLNDSAVERHRLRMLGRVQRVQKYHKIIRNKVRIVNWPIINKVVFVVHMLFNHKYALRISRRERRLFETVSNFAHS